MKEVFFMRHGRTSENAADVIMGWDNPPLSEESRAEILSIKPYVVRPDVVFSSDLRRASETARLLFPDCEIVLLPQLRERYYGRLQGKPRSVLGEFASWGIDRPDGEDVFTKAGGEPLSSVRVRAEQALNLVRGVDARKVMVVSHGGLINFFVSILLPKAEVGHTLGNLRYHKFALNSREEVVEAKLDQGWLDHRREQDALGF